MAETHLQVAMRHSVGVLQIDAQFRLTAPWTILFGPSGAGKSTVLRAIGGFVTPEAGEILFGPAGDVLFRASSRVCVRADLRPVRSVGQHAPLFPHMTVAENLSFAVSFAGADRRRVMIAEVSRLLGLSGLGERWPASLSGGERRRVAIARAVIAAVTFAGPSRPLLLLDEPFTGLDLPLRDALACDLQAWLRARSIPVLSVTHDVGEAFLLQAEVIRMGRILAQGPVDDVLGEERDAMLARLRCPGTAVR